jgi:hypothetical protein
VVEEERRWRRPSRWRKRGGAGGATMEEAKPVEEVRRWRDTIGGGGAGRPDARWIYQGATSKARARALSVGIS